LPERAPNGKPIESWMKFYGQYPDERGVPGPARAHFVRGVRAWTRESVLRCDEMWAYLDAPVDLANVRSPREGSGGRASERDRMREEAVTPRAQVVHVECRRGVDVVSREFDQSGLLVAKRQVAGELVTYNLLTDRFHVDSPGLVDLYERGKPFGPARPRDSGSGRTRDPADAPGRQTLRPISYQTQAAARTTARADRRRGASDVARKSTQEPPPLKLTRIWFDEQMIGQLNSTAVNTRRVSGQADFFGGVRIAHAVVADEDADLDPDAMPPDSLYMFSDTARVTSEPPAPGAAEGTPDRVLIQAWGELYALSKRSGRAVAIRASDHMNYNSETELSYIYGGEGGITIVDQVGAGQPASFGRGSTIIYNHKTGEHKVLDARSIQLIDPRAPMFSESPPRRPQKPKRPMLPPTREGDKERRNFSGR
jgi:hypothetical protein